MREGITIVYPLSHNFPFCIIAKITEQMFWKHRDQSRQVLNSRSLSVGFWSLCNTLQNFKMSSYPKRIKSAWQRSSRPRKKNPSLFSKKSSEKTDEPVGQSTSAKKLESASSEDVHWNPLHGYRFIEFFTVFTALSELVICRECKQNLKFEEAGNWGFKLVLLCRCGRRDINSGPMNQYGLWSESKVIRSFFASWARWI